MEIDKNKFKRLKRKVLRKFPKVSTQRTSDGKFFVSDGTGNVLLDEYMIPPQKTVLRLVLDGNYESKSKHRKNSP